MHRQFSIPGIKTSDRHIKTVASSTAGAIEATPNYACIYVLHVHGQLWVQLDLPMVMAQWDDGKRTRLGTYAFRDRYVVFPKSVLMCVTCCNLIALWRSSLICIFGALPDVCCTASSIGSTAMSHIALHVIRIHAYMES